MEPLQYNTKRKHLIIPEYGRHIHLMIEQTKAETDAQERNKKAKFTFDQLREHAHRNALTE